MTYVLGIDPGAQGGLALIGGELPRLLKAPDTERELGDFIHHADAESCGDILAVIEKLGPVRMPIRLEGKGDAAKLIGSVANANFMLGGSYGQMRQACASQGIPFELVAPAKWQRALGIPVRGKKTQTEHKRVLKAKAQQLFPGVKVTLWSADALLLAEYGRRVLIGRRNEATEAAP